MHNNNNNNIIQRPVHVAQSVAGVEAGTLQTSNGFSFLRVYDAGHMVRSQSGDYSYAVQSIPSGSPMRFVFTFTR